ncbi:MAG: sensor histidine kinase [Phycisphaerales bacterium]|jgi:signal transduction histidine kinase|nr:ATP-binding protein [Phycisphaeraceae bacterium]
MRIRKKLIVLHTLFSIILAVVLVVAMKPTLDRIIDQAEVHEARLAIALVRAQLGATRTLQPGPEAHQRLINELAPTLPEGVRLQAGTGELLGVNAVALAEARATPGQAVEFRLSPISGPDTGLLTPPGYNAAVLIDPVDGSAFVASVYLRESRASVLRLYVVMTVALLGVYALIALALEVLVLPQHVYGPIRRLLNADEAVRTGFVAEELIDERTIPADELGEIMRSRNRTVRDLRRHETQLARALKELETTATDLQRKNHLLETARRNLADADRLASLGMMSAGLAHEMNTPLAVVKGLVEKLRAQGGHLDDAEAQLLLRVTGRLERLSDSLLDFARVRPPKAVSTNLRSLVDEAWTLVGLDRDVPRAEFLNEIDSTTQVPCDPDRMLQVFVNLLRNAAEATQIGARGSVGRLDEPAPGPREPRVEARAQGLTRDGRCWITVTIRDNGPGLDPAVLARLFEPFASTKLDSRGTGLGLAVSEGIVREHGGLLIARNAATADPTAHSGHGDTPATGAIFEILLPLGGEGRGETLRPPDPVHSQTPPVPLNAGEAFTEHR